MRSTSAVAPTADGVGPFGGSARSLLAVFGLAAAFLVGAPAAPTDAQQTTSTWRGARTPWGDPDLQTPDHVAILVEMIHDARIVPLDGRSHVDRRIGQWLGDSRGRWEDDTLVVETTNLRAVDLTTISRGLGVITLGTSAAARVVERFTRRGPDAIDYEVTVDDPAVYTAPWTAAVPMTTREGPLFEYACHEGNYGMPGILAGHRAEERAAAAADRP